MDVISVEMVLSVVSFSVTVYFWLVQARKERPCLEFYQLCDFRSMCRRHPDKEGVKRLCIQQIDSGGVLVANHSTRQNSIILFDCYLTTDAGEIRGDWGYSGEDKPPWNIGPESTLGFSPACFFELPEAVEPPENPQFRMEFITASGKRFSHRFSKKAPRWQESREPRRRAA